MAGRRRRGGARPRAHSASHERAREHIRQAERLSRELGGADKDVKDYFFSLDPDTLRAVLKEYERLHGRSAKDYAEKALGKWKAGTVRMSGMVAERLFALLPKHMPIEQKYRLTESLWRHVAPASRRNLYVNPSVSVEEVTSVVRGHLERDVLAYKIPEPLERRFEWLSQGDVEVKQKLLNFLREKERELAAESLRSNIPMLAEQLSGDSGKLTHRAAHKLQIGKNEISVTLTDKVEGITESAPVPARAASTSPDWSWLWWIAPIAVVMILVAT